MLKQITWVVGFAGVVTLASANSGPENTKSVIHLGKPSRSERVPRVVNRTITDSTVMLIMRTGKDMGVCTGTLIAPHLILTAAHCVEMSPQHIQVMFYEGPLRFAHRQASIYASHPLYRSSGNVYDLALIYFEGTIPAGHAPAKLMNASEGMLDTFFFDQPSLGAGYGITANGRSDSGILREIRLKHSGDFNDTLAMADLEDGNSLCNGDSGGPIFAYYQGEYRVWGVASFVDEPFCLNNSYYTLVMPHMKWINAASRALVQLAGTRGK